MFTQNVEGGRRGEEKENLLSFFRPVEIRINSNIVIFFKNKLAYTTFSIYLLHIYIHVCVSLFSETIPLGRQLIRAKNGPSNSYYNFFSK